MILLLGEENSERTEFFMKAAGALGLHVRFIQIPSFEKLADFDCGLLENHAVKLDPPDIKSFYLDDLSAFGARYSLFLEKLSRARGVRFLNAPEAIASVFDKRRCKRTLANAGIRTADYFTEIKDISELIEAMSQKRVNGVFIKPRFGSGAAGVAAFRRNPRLGESVLYTTARLSEGRLYNTRKLRKIRDAREAAMILNRLLCADALVERWIPKASACGKAYDIRIIWQFDQIMYVAVRMSRGVITNLHTGGAVLELDELDISKETLRDIEALCRSAVALFPGLSAAGIDVLLERGTMKPYIIEINGQGDLLYRDINGENRIYRSQLLYLSS